MHSIPQDLQHSWKKATDFCLRVAYNLELSIARFQRIFHLPIICDLCPQCTVQLGKYYGWFLIAVQCSLKPLLGVLVIGDIVCDAIYSCTNKRWPLPHPHKISWFTLWKKICTESDSLAKQRFLFSTTEATNSNTRSVSFNHFWGLNNLIKWHTIPQLFLYTVTQHHAYMY